MGDLTLLVLCVAFVCLVFVYVLLTRLQAWWHSDRARRRLVARWLAQRGHSAPSNERIVQALNEHFSSCLQTHPLTAKDKLLIDDLVLVGLPWTPDAIHYSSVKHDDKHLEVIVGVSCTALSTDWWITCAQYGKISCHCLFHHLVATVMVEFTQSEDKGMVFSMHYLEPVSLDASVTVTSPAMKDSDKIGDEITMVIKDYVSCVNLSDISVIARTPSPSWESFTPRELVTMDIDDLKDSVNMETPVARKSSDAGSSVAMHTPTLQLSPVETMKKSRSCQETRKGVSPWRQRSSSESAEPISPTPLPMVTSTSGDATAMETLDNTLVVGNHGNVPNSLELHRGESPDQTEYDTKHDKLDAPSVNHMSSISVPNTPMKPHQSSSESSDFPHASPSPHNPLLPRRSHSYEHIEQLGLSSLATQPSPMRHHFQADKLYSVSSAADMLSTEESCDTGSYMSGVSNGSGCASLLVFEFQQSGITRHIAVDTTLDRVPRMRNATKLHISNDHVFVACTIKSTVVCEVCSKKIHRILGKRNAYMCRDCKVLVHKGCHGNVKQVCPASSYPNMTIKYAENFTPK